MLLEGGVEMRANTGLRQFHLSTGEVARNFSSPEREDRMLNERKRIESILGEGPARREEHYLTQSQNHIYPVTASAEGAWQSRCYTDKYPDGLLCLLTSLDLGKIKVGAIPKGDSPC